MSGIPAWAVKGAKVVCVLDYRNPDNEREGVRYPIVGEVYTVREIVFPHPVGGVGVRLTEIINPAINYYSGWKEGVFLLARFRPLTDTHLEADLRMFRDIADKAGAPPELTDSELERMAHDAVFGNGSGL